MKKIIILTFTIIFFVANLQAKNDTKKTSRDIEKIIGTKIPEIYQEAPAVNILDKISFMINSDYSYEKEVTTIKKIMNYEGKKKYSDITIKYNYQLKEVKLGKCYTISPDGGKIEIPKQQIIIQDDKLSLMSPEYIKNKNLVINFPKVEPGYFVVLNYTIISKEKEPFSDVVYFDNYLPTISRELEIKHPQDTDIRHFTSGEKIEKKEQQKGDLKVINWSKKNSSMIKRERKSPEKLYWFDKVILSCYPNIKDLAKNKLNALSNYKISENIIKLSKEICGDLKKEEDKVRAIYKYLATNFTTKQVDIQHTTFTPQNLDIIIKRKYGSTLELVSLFEALAQAVKIDNIKPALLLSDVFTYNPKLYDYPLEETIFDVVIAYKDKLIIPGNDLLPIYFSTKNYNYITSDKDYKPQYTTGSRNAIEENNFHYVINDQQCLVDVSNKYFGKAEASSRNFKNIPKSKRNVIFNQSLPDRSAQLVKEPVFDDFENFKNGFEIKYSIGYANYLIHQNSYTYFKILPFNRMLTLNLEKRETDLQIENTIHKLDKFVIEIKSENINLDKMKLISNTDTEENFQIGSEKAHFKMKTEIKDGKIYSEREIYIPTGIISQEEYQKFRTFLLKATNPINSKIFLEK